MVPSIIIAAVIPFGPVVNLFGRPVSLAVANINVGVLYLGAIASIAVYGIVLAGWSSNNKYAMLGGLRSSAQMISYELALGLMFVIAIMLANSMNLYDIVDQQKSMLVRTCPAGGCPGLLDRHPGGGQPCALRHAGSRAGADRRLSLEYSGMKFALFFMAEYQKMIVISMIAATLFFGGYREFWFLRTPS